MFLFLFCCSIINTTPEVLIIMDLLLQGFLVIVYFTCNFRIRLSVKNHIAIFIGVTLNL